MVRESDELKLSINKLLRRNQIMEIAEEIAPYFRTRKKDEYGKSARFISVKDIQYNQIIKDEAIEFDTSIYLLSDQGNWVEKIIIREFNNAESFNQEMKRYNELQQRFLKFPNFLLFPMINIDNDKFRIVYEKQTGYNIDQLGLLQDLTDYKLGQLIALIHGDTHINLGQSTTKALLEFLLAHLPFTDEERGSIYHLLKPHFKILSQSNGGYVPCTHFDPKKLLFLPLIEKDQINKNTLINNEAIQSILLIETPESTVIDRMADISVIFSQQANEEFLTSGDVTETKKCLTDFFEGYYEISNKLFNPNFNKMYPLGSTLNLQILINFWIRSIEMLQGAPGGISGFENKDLIRFSYYLLSKQPFNIFK